jgi:hypothetical protein
MRRHILYAYVDGSDLEEVAATLEARFNAFVASRAWVSGAAWAVSQKEEATTASSDLLRWDLGMNLELPDPGDEPDGWFSDIEEVAVFLRGLSEESDRGFVIGIADTQTGVADDLFPVSAGPVDIERLRDVIGVQEK